MTYTDVMHIIDTDTWVSAFFIVSALGILVATPFIFEQRRVNRENAQVTDFGWPDPAAKYRRQALLRDELVQSIRVTKASDRRRITAVTTGVIQTIPEMIPALPERDESLG